MSLAPGTRLGAYEITAPIGAGGMGEVYRAKDTRLNRDVAIKVLPAAFATDADRLARFKREAHVLASLNHPHIGAIYGLEESNGIKALVLELVAGPTLADRIAQGPIPMDEALPIARQIAEALEAAHEHGIIHRDLKPANIKLTADGNVKVLDFGLAKAMDGWDSGRQVSSADMLSQAPTLSSPAMTIGGVILGTAAYMSPEQAKAKTIDKRTDIWAFGCVLYEMLTGARAFQGDEVADTLAAILRGEPDWNAVPAETSLALKTLLRRCLEKDRRQRPGDTSALLFVLNEPALMTAQVNHASTIAVVPAGATSRVGYAWLAWTIAAVALLALSIVTVRHLDETSASGDVIQFTIPPPENASFATPPGGGTGVATQVAVSPDGRNVVFVASSQITSTQIRYQLWLRALGAVAAHAIPGTENGTFPFWSPDSRYIGFFANGKLKTVSVTGGPPKELCPAAAARGGTWNRDNVIVFAPSNVGVLQRVSAAGGVPQAASALDTAYGEASHRFPSFLPDGHHFVYSATIGTCCPAPKAGRIRIGALDTMDTTMLREAESAATVAAGHLLFNRNGTLMAQPFDAVSRRLGGDPFPIVESIGWEGSRYASFSASDTGVLVSASGLGQRLGQLTWMDRAGAAVNTIGDPQTYQGLALSSDDRRVAVVYTSGIPENRDIWIMDAQRGMQSKFTFDSGDDNAPVWSPDGLRILFQGTREGSSALRQRRVDGAINEEVVLTPDSGAAPSDWSTGGQYITYSRTQGTGLSADIWALPLFADHKPFPLVETPFNERNAVFSPDDRWFAYQSNESGQTQIYIQPFPPTGRKFLVSRTGGFQPVWRPDSKELFFISSDSRMMATPIDAARGQFDADPTPLFTVATTASDGAFGLQYAVAKDGQRFLVNVLQQQSRAIPLTVVVNWLAAVQK